MRSMLIAFVTATALTFGSISAQAGEKRADIVDTAVAAGSFKTLVTAVKAADLVATLKSEGPFTVFAPTDAAFAKVPADALNGLLADKKALTGVLTYHVVAGRLDAAAVVGKDFIETVNGQALRVRVEGGNVFVDGARVIKTDIAASNGIIHVLDAVVTPRKDIVDTAIGAGSFKTLVAAVKAAGLVDTLKSKGPFTVFAPTDAAFAKLPAGTIPALLADKGKLVSVLTYHVVPGRVLSTALKGDGEVSVELETVQGTKLRIKKTADGSVFVNDAKVVTRDLIVGNGIIHVLDAVIAPSGS